MFATLPSRAHPSNASSKSVLLVDADEETLCLCSYLVLQSGFRLHKCFDPAEAFTILADCPIDLVVTNLEFPGVTGIDLTHHVRTNYPSAHVVVMIPLGDVSGAARALRGGATDYLMKPFSADEFRRQLAEWSQGRGHFSRWARSQTEGQPERRTFLENYEIWKSVTENSGERRNRLPLFGRGGASRHAAIVSDAVRTLHQIIERDIEETAMFASIDVQELIAAFLAALGEEHNCSAEALGNRRLPAVAD